MRRSDLGIVSAFCVASALASCLPHDVRPEPAKVSISVTGAAPLLGGHGSMTTEDGWTLTYDRFLIGLGEATLSGDGCSSYYDASYRRVFDMQTAGAQKVSIVYGLGFCDFGFRLAGPDTDALLGAGVTAADKTFMGTPGTDAYVTNRGISLYAAGHASKGDVTKRFAWEFREAVRYEGCTPAAAPPDSYSFELKSGGKERVDLPVLGEALFFDNRDSTSAAVRFDAMAAADDSYGDGDGEITLSELGLVSLTDIATDGNYAMPAGSDPGDWKSLEDFVYRGLFPPIVGFEVGGGCGVRAGNIPR